MIVLVAGRYVDVQVDFLTAKFFWSNNYKTPDFGFGWWDVGISIDFVAIVEYFKEDF